MPEIDDFPAMLTLSNNTPSRFGAKAVSVRLEPYASTTVECDQAQYEKLKKSLAGHARLSKWDNLRGLQVKYDRKD